MKRVILFGASGNLGRSIAAELVRQGYVLTAVVRSEQKALLLAHLAATIRIADPCNKASLSQLLHDQDIVISALGKSVSPADLSRPSFRDVDFEGNMNILGEAVKAGIRKFVYISAFHAEKYPQLEYFNVHHAFSEELRRSGLGYSIIKPPAIFSAFTDMISLAGKGRLMHIGKGDKRTNPIYEGDLAKVVVDSIPEPDVVLEAGGQTIYTRKQLNELVQQQVNPARKIRTIPIGLFKALFPLIRLFSKNSYDKFAFFLAVMQEDTIAPLIGEMRFETYIEKKVSESQPGSYRSK